MKKIFLFLLFSVFCLQGFSRQWTKEQAEAWSKDQGWLCGSNFMPSTAINQLEMWQASTFDPETIDRELGWAESIGMNCMRVFLHHLAWQEDPEGFKARIKKYLSIADSHGIKTIFVFFDDCWNPTYQAGRQPDPKPGVHNSGWIRDPGDLLSQDSALMVTLKNYVKDMLTTFRSDSRILLWDLYNEPGNSGYRNRSLPLLKAVFSWAREADPEQPVSAGIWNWSFDELNRFQVTHSDVITYHDYEEPVNHKRVIQLLKLHGKPLICTEYMARPRNSRFFNIMPMLKDENVGAINWGLVAGKTNTKYAWDTPLPDGREPDEWFHDIFFPDGTPYCTGEVNLIKRLNGK